MFPLAWQDPSSINVNGDNWMEATTLNESKQGSAPHAKTLGKADLGIRASLRKQCAGQPSFELKLRRRSAS